MAVITGLAFPALLFKLAGELKNNNSNKKEKGVAECRQEGTR